MREGDRGEGGEGGGEGGRDILDDHGQRVRPSSQDIILE
jgi:hypothetical protein